MDENFVDLYEPSENEELQAIGQSSKYPAFTMQSPEDGIHLSTVDYMFMAKQESLSASQISNMTPAKASPEKPA